MKLPFPRWVVVGVVWAALGLGVVYGRELLAPPPPDDGPLGALAVEVQATPDGFDVAVRNRGRVPQSVAQVAVNAGIWPTDLRGPAVLQPGDSAHAILYYHWVPGEQYALKVIGSHGAVATGQVTPTG